MASRYPLIFPQPSPTEAALALLAARNPQAMRPLPDPRFAFPAAAFPPVDPSQLLFANPQQTQVPFAPGGGMTPEQASAAAMMMLHARPGASPTPGVVAPRAVAAAGPNPFAAANFRPDGSNAFGGAIGTAASALGNWADARSVQRQVPTQRADESNGHFAVRNVAQGIAGGLNPANEIAGYISGAKKLFSPLVNWWQDTPAAAAQKQRAAAGPSAAPGKAFDSSNPMADVLPASAQPGAATDVGGVANFIRSLGGTVTSIGRTTAHNRQVKGVSNSFHLENRPGGPQAIDSVPPKGMSMSAWHDKLKAQYPGLDVIDENNHVHLEPRQGTQTIAEALGGQLLNPFNAQVQGYGQQALAEIDAGAAAQMKPQTISFDAPTGAPMLEAPQLAPPTDWTKADAALQDMKPVEMTEHQKLKIERQGWFKGLGEALQRLPDGAGLGKTLAALGGGALTGRGAAQDEIRQREDIFDQKMAAWKAAVYSGETQKAQIAHQEAAHNLDVMNNYALNKFNIENERWQKDNNVSVGPAGVTVSRTVNGKTSVTTTPFTGAIMAGRAAARAQIFSNIGSQAMSGNAAVMNPLNSLVIAHAASQLGSGGAGGQEAFVGSQAMLAGSVVENGYAADLFGGVDSKDWKGIQAEAAKRAGLLTPVPTNKDETERYNNALAGMIAAATFNPAARDFRSNLLRLGTMGLQMDQAAAYRDRRTRTTSDSRGRTTTQVTE